MNHANQAPKRRRFWKIGLAGFLLALFIAAAGLPFWLNSGSGRRWLVSRANQALAPGGLRADSFRFSWFGPTVIDGFALIDHQGEHVVAASRAVWDRNLWQVLFDRPRYGSLRLQGATLDVERKADGTIDLYETLKPILKPNPKLDLSVVVEQARLRFRSTGIPEPVNAERADLTLHFAPAPHPLTWSLELTNHRDSQRTETLTVAGQYERWRPGAGDAPDLDVSVKGNAWPWMVDVAGVSAHGVYQGEMSFRRRARQWALDGGVQLAAVEAASPRLQGDRIRLDHIRGDWRLVETESGWDILRFDVNSPVVTLRASGKAEGNQTVEGTVDLVALARQLPHVLDLRNDTTLEQGSAKLTVSGKSETGRQVWEMAARLSDLRFRNQERIITLRTPAEFSAAVIRTKDSLAVERVALSSEFLNLEGRGDVDRGVELSGNFDLKALQHQLEDVVKLGRLELAGRGDLKGHYQRKGDRFDARMESDIRDIRIEGLLPTLIHQNEARIELALDGFANQTGLPTSWVSTRAKIESGTVVADVAAKLENAAVAWNVSAKAPLSLGDRQQQAQASLTARSQGETVTVERLELGLGDERSAPVQLLARGSVDLHRGAITLVPFDANAKSQAIALGSEGIHVSGIGSADGFRAELSLVGDMGELTQRLAPGLNGLHGTWTARADAHSKADGIQLSARVVATDVSERFEGPVAVSLDAYAPRMTDAIDINELVLASRFVTVEASGRLSEPGGKRQVALRGTVTPNWETLEKEASRIEPKAHVAGRPGTLTLKGDLDDLSSKALKKSLQGEVGFELSEANVYGMRMGPTPVILRFDETLSLAPIDSAINEGSMHLEPSLVFDEQEGMSVRLGAESWVRDAVINDEVSHRVLSFVAPVLENATRVRGRVSVALREAEFPITGGAERHAKVEGGVTFQDVEFVASPLVDDLFSVVGVDSRTSLKLNAPVSLAIADRRVRTEGLSLPLGKLTAIELSGWVDFDRNLSMTASVPVTPQMVGNRDFLSDVVEGARISVPIKGTLGKPRIDRDAFKKGLAGLGKEMLERTAVRGAAELLMRLARPRGENDAPPPPRLTPGERREQRRQRRMNRQGVPQP